MPFLKKAVIMPVKGIDFSVPSTFLGDQYGFPKNMRYYRGEMKTRPGKTSFGTAASSQIMGLTKLELNAALIKYLVRASKTKLQKYNTSENDWSNISTGEFTGGDDDFFFFTTVTESGLLLATNGVDVIKKWPGSGAVENLGGDPPLAKYMTYVSPYVILANIDDGISVNPWKIAWCDTDNPEDWVSGNAGEALVSDEPSPIQNIMRLDESAIVYKKESIAGYQKVDTSEVFRKVALRTGLGLGSSRAIAEFDQGHAFMSMNDFYIWNGVREQSIGGSVRDEVFGKIDRSKMNRCFAVHVQELTEIWFFIVVAGNSWPTEVWKYNYRSGFWYYDTCVNITAAVKWEKIISETWDDGSGPWDSDLGFWDSGDSIEKWEEIVFGNSAGKTLSLDYGVTDDDGVAVESVLETKDYIPGEIGIIGRWLQLAVWAKGSPGAKLYIDYSSDEGVTWTNIPLTSSTAYFSITETTTKYMVYFDVIAEKTRYRFRKTGSNEFMQIQNFVPYYLAKEDRR